MTWDMDSMDRASALRVYRFVFGYQMKSRSRTYRYKRFVEKEGVRYLGQSVLFVRPSLLQRTLDFLAREAIDHETTPARIG